MLKRKEEIVGVKVHLTSYSTMYMQLFQCNILYPPRSCPFIHVPSLLLPKDIANAFSDLENITMCPSDVSYIQIQY